MNRRHFIKTSGLISTAMMLPRFLKAEERNTPLNTDKVLVVIQLTGGNDGLNTVVPFENDIYYQARPTVAIPKSNVLKLDSQLGLHPEMKGFMELYQEGNMALINNVGYPEPDRSHFRSMDIWHTASSSKEYLSTGWIGR